MTTMDGPVARHQLVDEIARQTMDVGRDVILHIHAVLRVARFHAMDNDAALAALDRAYESLTNIFELQDEIEILYYAKDFYVNGHRVKSGDTVYELFAEFSTMLQSREIGSIHFPNLPTREGLKQFITIFYNAQPHETDQPFKTISQELMDQQIQDITVTQYTPDNLDSLTAIDKATFIKQSYFRAVQVSRELYLLARRRKPLRLKHAKRSVQNFIDIFDDANRHHSDLLLLLTGLKNWQGYLFNHSVNVTILAVGFARTLGLDRNELRDLGIAAMLADLGNVRVNSNILDSATEMTPEQETELQRHPGYGVACLSHVEEMDPALVMSSVVAMTHHLGEDRSGYPDKLNIQQALFSQVIAICDAYDAMTTPRPWRAEPLPPPKAMETLANEAGTRFNPLLTKAFIHWLGLAPHGTLVALSSGEVGMVIGKEARLQGDDRLRIRVIMEANKKPAGNRLMDVGGDSGVSVEQLQDVPASKLGRIQAKAVLLDDAGGA